MSDIPRTWSIGVDAWVIQDGNYPEFEVGMVAEFAVEWWLAGPDAIPTTASMGVESSHHCMYQGVAHVDHLDDSITVLDIGIKTFHETLPTCYRIFEPGKRVAVRLGLGVDPFTYFETLSHREGAPPLIYTWRIQRVLRCASGSNLSPADATYQEVARTNVREDQTGESSYVVVCELLPVPPKRASELRVN